MLPPPFPFGRLALDVSPPDGLIAGAAVRLLARDAAGRLGVTRNLLAGPGARIAMLVRPELVARDDTIGTGPRK